MPAEEDMTWGDQTCLTFHYLHEFSYHYLRGVRDSSKTVLAIKLYKIIFVGWVIDKKY